MCGDPTRAVKPARPQAEYLLVAYFYYEKLLNNGENYSGQGGREIKEAPPVWAPRLFSGYLSIIVVPRGS